MMTYLQLDAGRDDGFNFASDYGQLFSLYTMKSPIKNIALCFNATFSYSVTPFSSL